MRWYSAVVKKSFNSFMVGRTVYVRKEGTRVRIFWHGAVGGGEIQSPEFAREHLSLSKPVSPQLDAEITEEVMPTLNT
jgi:hypothetical protein